MVNNKHKRQYRSVLITGVAGSIGRALLDWLVENGDSDLRILGIDHHESGLSDLQRSYCDVANVRLVLADIRNASAMERYCRGVDLLIHLAALKHVGVGEQSPDELIASNLTGLQNVIRAAQNNRMDQMLFASSDKATYPSSAMGASKLIGERLVSAANDTAPNTRFTSVRFGNVLGSNASVLPNFRRALDDGEPLTLSHPDMTRFVMTLRTCARMLITAANIADGGETLVTRMPVVRIGDLAQAMIEERAESVYQRASDVQIVRVGIQPGEKMHEVLMTESEADTAVLIKSQFDAYYRLSTNASMRSRHGSIDFNLGARRTESSSEVEPMSITAIREVMHEVGEHRGEQTGMHIRNQRVSHESQYS